MKSLWGGVKFPIVAVIEDADNDRVWLFTKAKKKDETQAVFFEMAAEIRTQPFDHAKLARVKVKSRARCWNTCRSFPRTRKSDRKNSFLRNQVRSTCRSAQRKGPRDQRRRG